MLFDRADLGGHRLAPGKERVLGQLLAIAIALATPFLAACGTLLEGLYEFETFTDRSAVVAMPVAPPPPGARRIVDVSLREIAATVTSGGETSRTQTGMSTLRTDGAITVRLDRYFAIRALGGLGYGPVAGPSMPSVAWPSMPSSTLGLGLVVGDWGNRDWSIHAEVDALGVLVMNADTYEVRTGRCSSFPSLFGGDSISCVGEPTGRTTRYQGYSFAPSGGASLDVAGEVTDWLRIGGGLSVQAMIARSLDGGQRTAPVGITRLFFELRWEDASIALEIQQPIAEGWGFGPWLGISVRGAAFDRPNRRPPRGAERLGPRPSRLGADGELDVADRVEGAAVIVDDAGLPAETGEEP